MEKSLKYFPSLLLLLIFGCNHQSVEERNTLSDQLLEKSWHTYQGSVQNMNLLEAAVRLNPCNHEAWRELSIPYLKRGYPDKWFAHYDKAVKCGATEWVGARGHDFLYFYRDYERALQDFNALDTITPNFTDYPQATSDLYLRGLCYYGLEDYEKCLNFIQRCIEEQDNGPGGLDFLDPHVYLFEGLAHLQLGNYNAAEKSFENGLKLFDQSADLNFHLARTKWKLGEKNKARELLKKGKHCFEIGYYHKHGYVEVLEQLYLNDFESLEKEWGLDEKTFL